MKFQIRIVMIKNVNMVNVFDIGIIQMIKHFVNVEEDGQENIVQFHMIAIVQQKPNV